ncbi:LytTR family DNA-binding domain-containing protein [Pedobacter sp. MC2016-14]|uniref:LytR/AlgR family response regulator transcription factor n=1 Tax=Pedobacter sp. MC2016-14 TaxID=2897327 RepID=UPI001E658EAF|nr:LytTR family DNA-binding domain-containing protein [Pedobacter sp. MC2016-14]MCD0490434.1 LytTR family DNA-binding domain-containing protein [Pedobacter sp. MC2016-14]
MNCLIVDDNSIARSTLKQLLSLHEDLTLVAECADAIEATREMLNSPVDLLFLDIEMPGMSGIELARTLSNKDVLIIFTTFQRDYAAEAFDLNVVDFITKPIMPVRFLQALKKAKEIYKNKNLVFGKAEDDFVFIRDSNIVRRLKIDEILYLEAMGDYVKVYIKEKHYAIHSSLKSVEEKLPSSVFLRVHRSFIINISKIDTVEGGTLIINKNLVPVSDGYRANLNKRINIL